MSGIFLVRLRDMVDGIMENVSRLADLFVCVLDGIVGRLVAVSDVTDRDAYVGKVVSDVG